MTVAAPTRIKLIRAATLGAGYPEKQRFASGSDFQASKAATSQRKPGAGAGGARGPSALQSAQRLFKFNFKFYTYGLGPSSNVARPRIINHVTESIHVQYTGPGPDGRSAFPGNNLPHKK